MLGIYLTMGYPDVKSSMKLLNFLIEAKNVDFIEIGIPFSDPIADGAVIADASHKAILGGATTNVILEELSKIDKKSKKIYIMTYANIIYGYGVDKFEARVKSFCDGLIIPDLPNIYNDFFHKLGGSLNIMPFVTLQSSNSDIQNLKNLGIDCVYIVSTRGITGSTVNFDSSELLEKIEQVKSIGKKAFVGFGIKNKSDVDAVLKVADGAIIGTEAVKRQNNYEEYTKFIDSLS